VGLHLQVFAISESSGWYEVAEGGVQDC
jgi:hypothetical protein